MGREQMLGRKYWELFPNTVGTTLEREFHRVAVERTPAEFEHYYTPLDRWFQVKAYPAEAGGLSVFYRDVTAGRSLEAALRESEQRFRTIVETTPECVMTVGAGGMLLQMNQAGLVMLGARSAADVIGKNICDVIAPESRDAFRAFNEAICRGERGSLEFDIIALDGKRRSMETHAAPLRQPDGSWAQLAITHDISERNRRVRAALLLGTIVGSSDDAIVSKDLNGIIMSWNKGAERLFGYTAEEVTGKSITVIIPEDRLHEEPEILSRLRRGERIDHFETIRRRKDGTFLNVSLTIWSVRDASGKIIGASKIARDITEAKRAERSALLLAAIVDSSQDAIVSKDLNGTIMSWNKGAERLFGYSAAEAVGKPITIIIPPDRLGEEPNILSRIRRGERVDHFETIRVRKDGTLLDISLTISPVRDARGKIIGASKIARDISDRKRAEKAIDELNAQLIADLAAMTRIQALSARLVEAGDLPELLAEVLDAGMHITSADMGHVQLLETGALKIVAQRGLETALVDVLNQAQGGRGACGTALRSRQRVIVPEIATSPEFAGTPEREQLLKLGVQAVQSTPLVSRTGAVLGIFSTYYRTAREPGDRALRLLDIVARLAAGMIERNRAEEALLASEARFRQLADAMPQIVWSATPDGSVDYFNERWYQFTGFCRSEPDGTGGMQLCIRKT